MERTLPMDCSPKGLARAARWGALLTFLLAAAGCSHMPVNFDRRVLVLDFQNNIATPQEAALGGTLAGLLTANLANHPKIAVVERVDSAAQKDANWQDIGREANVDYVIIGSLSRLHGNYIVSARLLSMATGEVVKGSAVERSCNREEDLYPLMEAIGNVMAQNLRVLSERYEAWVRQPRGIFSSGNER